MHSYKERQGGDRYALLCRQLSRQLCTLLQAGKEAAIQSYNQAGIEAAMQSYVQAGIEAAMQSYVGR